MNIKADLHTHTIVSGHAYSSLQEMARAASDKGLEVLSFQIADYANLYPLLAKTEFPDELILNYDTSKLLSLLK